MARFNMIIQLPKHLRVYLVCFTDASADFSAACIYMVTWDIKSDIFCPQLITSCSRIQTAQKSDPLLSIPRNEVCTAHLGSEILLHVANLCLTLKIKVVKAFQFIDAMSAVLALNRHPSLFRAPFKMWLAKTNVNLFQVAQITHQEKEDIHLFINQKKLD